MALTGKRRVFADAVIAGKSNRDAAIAAGYSVKTASAAGSRLVKDPEVAASIASRRKGGKKEAVPVAPPPKPASAFDLGAALAHKDPKAFLLAAMNDLELDPRQRIDAAKALMPFMHKKLGEGGKKEQKDEEAKNVAKRFGQAAPPKLVANGGRKV